MTTGEVPDRYRLSSTDFRKFGAGNHPLINPKKTDWQRLSDWQITKKLPPGSGRAVGGHGGMIGENKIWQNDRIGTARGEAAGGKAGVAPSLALRHGVVILRWDLPEPLSIFCWQFSKMVR